MPSLPAKRKAQKRAAYAANKEQRKAEFRAWYDANKDAVKARVKAWRARNPEKVTAYKKAWEAKNPDEARRQWSESQKRRRNREIMAEVAAKSLPVKTNATAIRMLAIAEAKATQAHYGIERIAYA